MEVQSSQHSEEEIPLKVKVQCAHLCESVNGNHDSNCNKDFYQNLPIILIGVATKTYWQDYMVNLICFVFYNRSIGGHKKWARRSPYSLPRFWQHVIVYAENAATVHLDTFCKKKKLVNISGVSSSYCALLIEPSELK
jgi:hypothetical protein